MIGTELSEPDKGESVARWDSRNWASTRWSKVKRWFRFWWQRRTRGFDDSDTWSLDAVVARFMLPRLDRFIEVTNCHPPEMTHEEWLDTVREMRWYLGVHAGEHGVWVLDTDELQARYDAAGLLFGKYFGGLWW